jgi:hypothetical protein
MHAEQQWAVAGQAGGDVQVVAASSADPRSPRIAVPAEKRRGRKVLFIVLSLIPVSTELELVTAR